MIVILVIPRGMSKLKEVLEFDLDAYDEDIKKRLCLEVPCVVDLSQCNVITWFERQVEKKVQNNRKWNLYRDKPTVLSFLEHRGSFLYDKYLKDTLRNIKVSNQRLMRYMVWVEFLGKYPEDCSEGSIQTIFDSSSLLSDLRSIPSFTQASISLGTEGSYPFEHDLDHIITSTQQSLPWCSQNSS